MARIITILLLFICSVSFGQTSMRSGIEAYYKFEDNANDETGNNDGTPANVTYTTGIRGNSAVFNGSTAYVDNNDLIDFTTVDKFSISLWVNSTSTLSKAVFSKYNSSTGDRSVLIQALGVVSDQQFRVILSDDGTYDGTHAKDYLDETRAINTGSWIHLVITFDAGTLKMYHNGADITGDVTKTSDGAITTIHDSSIDVTTGGGIDSGGSPTSFYDGKIDEQLILTDRVYSDLEVKMIWNDGDGLLYVLWENFINGKITYSKWLDYSLNLKIVA